MPTQPPDAGLPRPSKIVCIGLNYAKHAAEFGNPIPEEPLVFLKPPSALIGPGEAIVLPAGAGRVDFEGEIGVRIGARARHVAREAAWEHVDGLLALNDVTARELQRKDGQWSRAKGFDTFCPIGPVTPLAEIDRSELSVTTRVNGDVRQQSGADDMVFDIPALIAHVSAIMTLEPGDLIATGTPSGVGPLAAGDVVEIEIGGGGGKLSNPVVAEG
ncbi:MAG TPA: fumarylacetoacetate hydrolase family protein [Candidatus Limnocylindrales bacterium]|nr:fumarylacetoacetate hydrolase family protein [Candidatus Limnocylindrales bacterium]